MERTIWVHINPKNHKKKGITYFPVVCYEDRGKPPLLTRVLKGRSKNNKNQYDLLLTNIEFLIQVVKSEADIFEGCTRLIIVSSNQAIVSWFQKGNCPFNYKDQFSRVISNLKTLPVGSLGITDDIPCLAEKYCKEFAVTDNYTESNDTEEDYISIVDIFSRTGGGDVSC